MDHPDNISVISHPYDGNSTLAPNSNIFYIKQTILIKWDKIYLPLNGVMEQPLSKLIILRHFAWNWKMYAFS